MHSLSPRVCDFSAAGRHHAARCAGLILLSGLFLIGAPLAIVPAKVSPIERAGASGSYAAHIADAAQRFGIPPAWITAVMWAESGNNARAISSKGAIGLMQIMPKTWADLRIRHSLGADPFDPRDNILAGAAYLREMHDRYGLPGFLAAYNAGPGRYEEHLAGRPLPAETRAYVAAIVPILGGGELAVAAADPQAWKSAPLFVVQPERAETADAVQRGGDPDDAPTAANVRDLSAIAPQSDGLFITRNPPGKSQ